jgi:DNA replication and repair protein RecF
MAYQNNRTNTVLNTKQIKSFDLQLAESAIILARYRKTYCEKLTDLSRQTIKEIFDQESKLIFDYQPSFNTTSSQAFISQLENNTQQDIMSKTTSLGPHRDEFYLYFNNSKTNDCGSTGQQKMSYLSLVFSHFELCFEKLGVHPIVLIDDISGELDSLRWKNLIEYLKKKSFQVVITTANDAFRKELTHSNESKLFSVTEGIVEEVKSSLKDSHIGA